MWGATLAGMAFGNSGTHLPHAMSYGITNLMNDITTDGYIEPSPFIPHGISVVVNAPAIFKFLAEGAPARHFEGAKFLGSDTKGAHETDSGEIIAKRIIQLMRETNLPNGISGVGFQETQVKALAESSMRQTRAIQNAPREANLVDMENIYRDSLVYW